MEPHTMVFLGILVVAIVIGGIIIYKNKKNSTKIHKLSTNGSSADKKSQKDKSSFEFTTYEEIKEKTENCQLRQRKLPQTDVSNTKETDENNMYKSGNVSQGVQTSNFDNLQQLPVDMNFTLNSFTNNNINDLVTSNYADSVCSLNTMSTLQDENNICQIPTWNEMSDWEKNLCICPACNKYPVVSIMKPCNHPYMCKECALLLYSIYKKCAICEVKGIYECIN